MKNKLKLSFIFILTIVLGLALGNSAFAQPPKPKTGQQGGFNPFQMDSRVKELSYHFADTNEDLKYCLFVSSKVSKDKKAPLIVTLHGLGAGPSIMVTKQAVDLAEKGGYILVAPMGYNERGWYGIKMNMGAGMAGAKSKPGAPGAKAQSDSSPAPKPKAPMFYNPDDPENLNELSEKDVMNVLNIVLKEHNIDKNRIYLMGHSMGGAGTLHLGIKYGSIWAALAPIAPAAFALEPDSLEKIKNTPIIFVHGAADEVVPVDISHRWVKKAKELNMTCEFNEMEGISHGPVIMASLDSVYEFFNKHAKSE